MAMNKTQFQKSLGLSEFFEKFGTEEQCFQVLFYQKWPSGYRCPECNNKTYCRVRKKRVLQCNHCHYQTSVTANTIFHSSNLPLTKWFLAIYLLTQSKNGIAAMALSRQVDVSYKTAWMMKHKLMQVMKEQEDKDTLSGRVEIDDSYLGGKNKGGKRGRGSENKLPFIAAVQTSEDKRPLKMKLRVVKGFTKVEVVKWQKTFLQNQCLLVTDGLACFRSMAKGNHIHHREKVYKDGVFTENPAFNWVNTILGNLKNALRSTYKANAQKYAQRYLSEFEYRFNRRFDLRSIFRQLLNASVVTPPMPERLLKIAVNPT